MKCSDVERILPDIIDRQIDGVRLDDAEDFEFQSHLKACPDCSELVSDLELIATEARQLSSTEEPPPRVWVRIDAQLRAEGLIHEPEPRPADIIVPARPRRWNAFLFAPVAVAVLAAGSYLVNHRAAAPTAQPVAQKSGEPQPETQPETRVAESTQLPAVPAPAVSAPVASATPPAPRPGSKARTAPTSSVERAVISPPASADDQQFLSEVSERAPGMRATYANQLQAVNNEIRETQAYIKLYPRDIDARQHLMEVYQQKAMLYEMALDRIQ